LAEWNAFSPYYENFVSVGSFYELNGFAITPVTTAGIKYYPNSTSGINVLTAGMYNITATIVLSATNITGAGTFSFGVTSNSAATNWLPSSNGNFIGSLTRTDLPSITASNLPIVLSVNFNSFQNGAGLYFIYEIQGTITAGSLTVNYSILRHT
jgi:hypothetical protein